MQAYGSVRSIHVLASIVGPVSLTFVMIWLGVEGKYETIAKFWIFAVLIVGLGLVPALFLRGLDTVDEFMERLVPNIGRAVSHRPGLILIWALNVLIYVEVIALVISFLPSDAKIR